MAYYTKVLQPDETVKYVGKLHWTIYRNAILFGIVLVGSAAVCLVQPDNRRPLWLVVVAVLLLMTVIAFVGAWFVRWGTEIVVTDKRIIHKTGWIARRTQEIGLSKVETVDVAQGIIGRILGFGTVIIRGTGGSWEPLFRVASPLRLRNAIIVD
jgi:uncharacterized membrane protein YdbT with pleckstrin-like domain